MGIVRRMTIFFAFLFVGLGLSGVALAKDDVG